jgi:hypothetical protein
MAGPSPNQQHTFHQCLSDELPHDWFFLFGLAIPTLNMDVEQTA